MAIVGLTSLLDEAGLRPSCDSNFEELYSSIVADDSLQDLQEAINLKLREYFDDIEIPRHVTIYDKLLASLRRKDLVASFNWDPLLIQAYYRNRPLRELPAITFLHGNVGVGFCKEHRRNGFAEMRCTECGRAYEPSPLLYPVTDKEYYRDPFISSQWAELELKLQ